MSTPWFTIFRDRYRADLMEREMIDEARAKLEYDQATRVRSNSDPIEQEIDAISMVYRTISSLSPAGKLRVMAYIESVIVSSSAPDSAPKGTRQ